MSEYDGSGLPIIAACPARHPETGNGCIEPAGHDDLHRAMGALRLQWFGPQAACSGNPA